MTTACLRDVGIMLCLRLLFTMEVMTGRRDGRIYFTIFVGRGSRQHDFEFPSTMSFEICCSDGVVVSRPTLFSFVTHVLNCSSI